MEGKEESEGQSQKREEREGGSETWEGAQGPLAKRESSIWIFL